MASGKTNFGEATRIYYLDIFRGLIILMMIQGHLLRLILSPGLRGGAFFVIHEYVHGVVAPGFLFLSGYLFYHTIKNKRSKDLLIRFRGYLGVLLIGYFLHLPYFSFGKIIDNWGNGAAEKFLYMDILQTIGYSLIISLLFRIISKKNLKLIAFFMVLLNLSIAWFEFVPKNFFLSFFFSQHNSQFPFFPWSIFFFTGILISGLESRLRKHILSFSIILLVFATTLHGNFSKVISDLGKILFLFILVSAIKKPRTDWPLFEKFLRSSRESLFLYSSHIMIIYGSVLNKGLFLSLTYSESIISTFILFILLSIPLYIFAYFLNAQKSKNPKLIKLVKYSVLIFLTVVFLLRKY